MKITVGTRSLLYGVHQFLFHPLTVWLAWTALYGKFPKWHENAAIFFHDWGYFGCSGMDNEEGRQHPVRGAALAGKVVLHLHWLWVWFRYPIRPHVDETFKLDKWCEGFELAAATSQLALGHSRFYAKQAGLPVSPLFYADKASIYFDLKWIYLTRAIASGEVWEYMSQSGLPLDTTEGQWFDWYRVKVGKLL